MYCPNCKQEFDGKFCPECGTKLIEKPATQDGFNLHLGDANAISGGVNLSDSHAVHNEDKSVHNTSNVSNVTHNITNVAAQKSELEIHQESMNRYREEFKKAYDDEQISPAERSILDDFRFRLHLSKDECERIEQEVKNTVKQAALDSEMNFFDKIDLEDFIKAVENNDIDVLEAKLNTLKSIADNCLNDNVQFYYYMVLSTLDPEQCIEHLHSATISNYWLNYWSYYAYLFMEQPDNARRVLNDLQRKFNNYPQDNVILLAATGAYYQEGEDKISRYLSNYHGNITPLLTPFANSLIWLIDEEKADRLGIEEESCSFYFDNFFNLEDEEEETVKQNKNKTYYVLLDRNPRTPDFIRTLTRVLDISLNRAIGIINSGFCVIAEDLSLEEAENIKEELEAAGAMVRINEQ